MFNRTISIDVDRTTSAGNAWDRLAQQSQARDAVVALSPKGQKAIVENVPVSQKGNILDMIARTLASGLREFEVKTDPKTTGVTKTLKVKVGKNGEADISVKR